MKFDQDDQFRTQRETFAFRFNCEDCAFFVARDGRCAHGYPSWEHRKDRYRDQEAYLAFCKEFSLL